jgi:peptidoglycan hydrolase-like protein with peptidoglycan-binding domain
MRHFAALAALSLLASTAAYAQNAPQAQPQSSQNQATETHGSQALAGPFVRQIQLRLRAQGVFEGKPTGTWDDETSKAVYEFQQAHDIQPTGQIDAKTMAALMRGLEGEGSSVGPTRGGTGMSMLGMRLPVLRSYERGYQQGFQQGLRWAMQEQEQEQTQEEQQQ